MLDPTAETPQVTESGLRGLMRTEFVLQRVAALMPEITAYIDARNYSPVSMVSILKNNPNMVNNVVVKIYPFTMPGGVYDFLETYAQRYDISYEQAQREVASVNMNVLLAMGAFPGKPMRRRNCPTRFPVSSLATWRRFAPICPMPMAPISI
ncbi:hypothetical protein CWS02_04935 [Enterobacter sp. EA-1]|nr:hypothetical protein CWS02_04935 [Enterobacter sp. EA-1]